MIKSIKIDNFKSLVDFELDFAKFTCLVGLNGSGKSTVLQAMDFLSQLMQGDVDEWLRYRHWTSADINSKLTSKSNIDFEVVLDNPIFGDIVWIGSFNRASLCCTQESVKVGVVNVLKVENSNCQLRDFSEQMAKTLNIWKMLPITTFPIVFEYQGSILSQLKDNQTNPLLQLLKSEILNVESLDLLSPELLRTRTKTAGGKLGLGGEKLAAFIHESGKDGKAKLQQHLAKVYTQLESIETRSLPSGFKELEIVERFGKQKIKSSARQMNDGLLRLMAILSQIESAKPFLLFDEIENGINPELIEFLIDRLVNATTQVLVTTHSPMILNYMEDEIAVAGIVYLYKNNQGITRSIKLFDIPSMAEKLKFMGPGEVFADTDLTNLYQEIDTLH